MQYPRAPWPTSLSVSEGSDTGISYRLGVLDHIADNLEVKCPHSLHQLECVARHERSFARYEQVLDLEDYLDVLERKPGA